MTDPIDRPYLESVDPAGAQEGVDPPGPQPGWTDFVNFGIYNGNFRLSPPQAASNLDVSSSLSGSNFAPGWRFVQSSNARITAQVVGNTSSASGSNLRFTFASAVNGDAAYVEQLVDIGGSKAQWTSNVLRAAAIRSDFTNTQLAFRLQYLDPNGGVVGMPPEINSTAGGDVPAMQRLMVAADTSTGIPPATARYLRIRLEARATAATSGTIDVYDVRRERGTSVIRIADGLYGDTGSSMSVFQMSGILYAYPPSSSENILGTSANAHVLNRQLLALPFSLVNVPANTTTELQMWGDTALALGTPRIGAPWGGDIVGVSYRMSTAITAGGASALRIQATVGGASVWTAHTLTTTSPVSGEATQMLGTDTITAGQQLGLQVVTSSTFTPTSLDLACLLWIALRFDGN